MNEESMVVGMVFDGKEVEEIGGFCGGGEE